MKRIFTPLQRIWRKVLGKKEVTIDNNTHERPGVTNLPSHVIKSNQPLHKREEPYFLILVHLIPNVFAETLLQIKHGYIFRQNFEIRNFLS